MPSGLVVGGGLSGSAAAVRLAREGWKVTLLERGPRLGGKVSSFRRGGRLLDNGQHVATRACTAFRTFLEEVGAADRMRWQPRMRIPFASPGGRITVLERGIAGLMGFDLLSWGERLGLGRVLSAAAGPAEGTFADWLSAHGQGAAAVSRFWDPLAYAVCNASCAEIGADAGLWTVREGLRGAPDALDLGIPAVPQAELFAPGVEAFLGGRGGRVRACAVVEGVREGEVRLRGGEVLNPDGIVVAVPWEEAEALLGLPPSGLRPGGILSVSVLLDRPVLPEGEEFVALVDCAAQWAFAKPPDGRLLSVVVSGANRHMDRPGGDLVAMVLASLRACLPRMEGARVLDAIVMKEKRATFLPAPVARSERARGLEKRSTAAHARPRAEAEMKAPCRSPARACAFP